MDMRLYLPTLSMVVEAAALTIVYFLTRLDQQALEMRHGTTWKKAEKVGNKFATTEDRTAPRYSLDRIHRVIIPTREEWGKTGLRIKRQV